jgi:hypothetical protein
MTIPEATDSMSRTIVTRGALQRSKAKKAWRVRKMMRLARAIASGQNGVVSQAVEKGRDDADC